MNLRIISISLALFFCFNLSAQKAKFYASTDARKVVEGSYVEVRFTLEDGQGANFRPPAFKDFTIISGPQKSSSTSIINGDVTREMSYSYGVQPKGLGRKTIEPASMRVNGKTLQTQVITIEVVKGSERPTDISQQIFVKTLLTDTSSYVGQQLLLDYKLYTTLDVRSINFNTELTFDGFYVEELRQSRQNYQREVINGVEYYTRSIKKISLFPQQTGTYKIEPASISLGIAKKGSQRGFFFNSQLIQKPVLAEGVTIYVNSLPTSTNEYTGAVGRYKMTVNRPKRSITTDEAIVVNMEVTGNGDSKTVKAPRWTLPEGLEMYDPNIISDEVFPSPNGLTHRKKFEYLIVAKKSGTYRLNPTFEYFNTDTDKFETLNKDLGRINVIQGSNTQVVVSETDKVELAGIFETATFSSQRSSPYGSVFHWILLALPFIGSIGVFLYCDHLQKSGQFDPELIRKNKAYEIAISRLQKSKTHLDAGDSKSFHEEMIISLKTYITDKFNIPALHIKRAVILEQLGQQNISEESISSFETILEQSEMAMYAPGLAKELQGTYDLALNLIADLEK